MSYTTQIENELNTLNLQTGDAIAELAQKVQAALVALANTADSDTSALEAQIADLQSDLATLSSSVDANALADLQAIADRIAGDSDLSGSISELQNLIDTNAALITSLQGIDSTFQTTVDALDLRVDSAESSITSLQNSISTLESMGLTLSADLNALTNRVKNVENKADAIVNDLSLVSLNARSTIRQGFHNKIGAMGLSVTIGGTNYDLTISGV